MTTIRRALALFPTLALLLPLAAAQGATWYRVEVIIFERTGSAGAHAEHWRADPGRPELARAVELSAGAGTAHAYSAAARSEYALRGAAARLENSGAYRVLMHTAWRQPGFGRNRARPIHLRSGPKLLDQTGARAQGSSGTSTRSTSIAASRAGAEGTVRLYRSRYLHFEADLLYHRPAGRAGAGSTSGTAGTAANWQPTLFRLRESRRMRSEEIHYLDHPLFGVLVQAHPFEVETRSEEPAEEPAPSGDSGDAGAS